MGAATRDGEGQEVLTVEGLTKRFGETLAVDNLSFSVRRGEIHGLLGTNGSGKSTVIKSLAGVYQADSGIVRLGTAEIAATALTPSAAAASGLRFVHQSRTTLLDMTVAENLAIGHGFPVGLGGRIRWAELHRHTQEVLDRFGIDAHPRQSMRILSPAVQTTIAIARALQDLDDETSGVLVLDEPTAALPRAEVNQVFDALRRYADASQAIIMVTHRIDEILEICHQVTVLRDGRLVESRPADGLDEASLIRLMIGRPLDRVFPHLDPRPPGEIVLQAEGLTGGPLTGVDLALRAGEVVGIAGLLGSGRSELLQTLFGLRHPGRGTIRLHGGQVKLDGPSEAMAAGIAYVPEDRAGAAAFLDMSVTDNLGIARTTRRMSRWHLDKRGEREAATTSMTAYSIKAPSIETVVGTLSGGNQQKVILARWLSRKPAILLLDEPTQGVDIGARAEIYELIRSAVADGCAVLIVTSDFEELIQVCDRILVLANGRTDRAVDASEVHDHELTEIVYSEMEVRA